MPWKLSRSNPKKRKKKKEKKKDLEKDKEISSSKVKKEANDPMTLYMKSSMQQCECIMFD